MGLTFRDEAERAAWSSAWDAAITDPSVVERDAAGCADLKIEAMRKRTTEASQNPPLPGEKAPRVNPEPVIRVCLKLLEFEREARNARDGAGADAYNHARSMVERELRGAHPGALVVVENGRKELPRLRAVLEWADRKSGDKNDIPFDEFTRGVLCGIRGVADHIRAELESAQSLDDSAEVEAVIAAARTCRNPISRLAGIVSLGTALETLDARRGAAMVANPT